MLKGFKEWLSQPLSQQSPQVAGDLEDNQSNSDRAFGITGAKAKNFTKNVAADVSYVKPEKLYGKKRRRR